MSENITIAVDAMGGDNSPEKVIKGISLHSLNSQNITYKIFGDEKLINPLIKKNEIQNDFIVHHTIDKINNDDTALGAAKRGKNTSMWMSVNSVKEKNSDIVISAGNTGALFVIAKLNLKMIQNIDKPALSALWPNKNGLNVVLDLGANIECSEKNLVDFSIMGAALHKSLFPSEICKVALLNIGSEEIKGNNVIKNTYKELSSKTNKLYDFCGYIEGNHIMDGKVNIIVTDGFTGNIALKTAEGTANFITGELKSALTNSVLGKISSLLNIKNLNNFKKKLDPRVYNGAMLLGLDSPVVKSHGGTDHIGFYNSLNVCEKIVKGKLIKKIKENIN